MTAIRKCSSAWSSGRAAGTAKKWRRASTREVKRLLEECYQKAVDALSANRDRMEKLVDALLKYDTISRREFVTLMETGALPDIQDADTRTTGDVMMQDMADEKKEESSEKSAETPEKSAGSPRKDVGCARKSPDCPPMKPDLHTHTTASDGLLTPAELVALADKHRVTLLAVTDHDTFDGAAQLLGKPTPMPILQGVELSLRDMPGLHLLGYGRGTDTPLHRKVRALSQMRLGRARQMVEKLNALGYPLDYDEIAREAKGSVGRPHIARAMVSRGYVADTREAFDRFLADGAPAYVAGGALEHGGGAAADAGKRLRARSGAPDGAGENRRAAAPSARRLAGAGLAGALRFTTRPRGAPRPCWI